MGRHLRDANRHAEKIDHFYKHAGSSGYSQAEYHWNELSQLLARAIGSKNDRSDGVMIREIIKDMRPKMDEMKKRKGGE